jgi:predicted HD phosphohydrolase
VLLAASCKSDDDNNGAPDPRAENLKALGTSGEDMLSDDIYQRLTVEIVYSEGFRPTQETIDNLETFLDQRLHKPGGVQIVETVIPLPGTAPYVTNEIRAIEDDVRTRYTEGDELAVFVFFADGNAQTDSETSLTLGTAYRNTSIAIYERTLQEVSASPQTPDRTTLETTTLLHEFGHLLGLVNILNDDVHTDHEDVAHAKHCVVEECLMYFETQLTRAQLKQRLKFLANIPELDPLCIADLQAKGGK